MFYFYFCIATENMFMFAIWIYLNIFVRTRFPYHMMSESFNSYSTGTTSGARTAYLSLKLTHHILVGFCYSILRYLCRVL